MTIYFNIGRRVPRSWLKRGMTKIGGFITFQENIWLMISQAINLGKRAEKNKGKMKCIVTKEKEDEDLNYQIEWLKVILQGTEEEENHEYEQCQKFYLAFNKYFKKDIPKDDMSKVYLRTKMLSTIQLDEAYKNGYGCIGDNNLANKLLELGIITHMEWKKDFAERDMLPNPDF